MKATHLQVSHASSGCVVVMTQQNNYVLSKHKYVLFYWFYIITYFDLHQVFFRFSISTLRKIYIITRDFVHSIIKIIALSE